uniref:AB hydrolase-1 domain-containing protein n=1 Tax=Trypanosoma congolense (strain IL3000) TaxID=1068625 RepID=G0UQS4_TRYCI|nr:conserved hypothetical protein [Trypanosoma congolense IL3000]
MRLTWPVRCTAAATGSLPLTKPIGGSVGNGAVKYGRFKLLGIQPWQKCSLEVPHRKLVPQTVMFHGRSLGPRPLIILDHTTHDLADAVNAAEKYEPMLSELSWDYGAVYIPLQIKNADISTDLIEQSCRTVCAVMDALDVHWTHFLTYSYGALVGARMMKFRGYPHRIGTLVSLDTPLVARNILRNDEQRNDIAKAEQDVNVPERDLSFAKETLNTSLEETLPCPHSADDALYRDYLFDSSKLFSRGGLVRSDERYVSVRHLAEVRHPLQIIVPSANALSDAAAHSEVFAIRRPSVVKSCQRHGDLFTEGAAKEVANVLGTWLRRFEPDWFIAKRYEQSAEEMQKLMTRPAQSNMQPSTKIDGEPRKKREKKKSQG